MESFCRTRTNRSRLSAGLLSIEREEKYNKLTRATRKVHLSRIQKIPIPNRNLIFAIEEWLNPTGSLFDRLYPHLYRIAESEGLIVPGVTPLIEVSTGNAGASFAWCAANLGYTDCTVIIHEDAPRARIEQIEYYGAKIQLSPAGQYAKGYVTELERLLKEDKRLKGGTIGTNPKRLYCVSKINPRGREVYYALTDNVMRRLRGTKIDFFIGVAGSGTSVSGMGKRLKKYCRDTEIIVVEPKDNPTVYSFKYKGIALELPTMVHEIFGIAPFGLPYEKLNLDLAVIDRVELIEKDIWKEGCRVLAEYEGKPVGRSSGAVFMFCLELARRVVGKNMLIFFYDPLWKYDDTYPFLK